MEKRLLGKTGLEVTIVGYGAIKLPGITEAEADECLNLALVALGAMRHMSGDEYGDNKHECEDEEEVCDSLKRALVLRHLLHRPLRWRYLHYIVLARACKGNECGIASSREPSAGRNCHRKRGSMVMRRATSVTERELIDGKTVAG